VWLEGVVHHSPRGLAMPRTHVKELVEEVGVRGRGGVYCAWIDEEEWRLVCSWLHGENPEDLRRGVDRVSAWRARGSIPFPVEATADIVDCLLREKSEVTAFTEESRSLVFAMIITRFINGVSDYGTWQGFKLNSIYEVVAKCGIPFWLVALRHDSTHRLLPSLSSLKKGIAFIQNWLWINYWKPHCSALSSANVVPEDDNPVKHSHVKLTTLKQNILKYVNTKYSKKLMRRFYRTLSMSNHHVFLSLLQTKSFLFPVTSSDTYINVHDRSKLALFPILPSSLIDKWRSLLVTMGRHCSHARSNLIHALIIGAHSHEDGRWRLIMAGWCGLLLGDHHHPSSHDAYIDLNDVNSDELLNGTIKTFQLIEVLRDNPGIYSYAITNRLLSFTSKDYKNVFSHVLQLTALLTISERCHDDHSLPLISGATLDHLEDFKSKVKGHQMLGDEMLHNERVVEDESIIWNKADGYDWLNCPLGLVPGQSLTPLSLELPNISDHHLTGIDPTMHSMAARDVRRVDGEDLQCDKEIVTSGSDHHLTQLHLELIQRNVIIY
jgi:hypothetical protein